MATTLPTFHDIPKFAASDLNNPTALVRKLEQMREQVQLIIGTRGPGRGRAAWFQQMIDAGLMDRDGNPIDRPPGSDDDSPPPVPENLTVTPAVTRIFVRWKAPTYFNGGGNALTTIYGVSRSPEDVSPPPTFGDAVILAAVPFGTEIIALPSEPHVEWHIWITFTSYANQEGPPAGGTNGATCVSDQLNGAVHIEVLTVTDALIATCGVDKLTAGSISVGEYIQSSGFVSGALGFRISGNGDAEFNNAIFRGLIEADAGLIGGIVIDASGVESDNYVAATSGFRLDNTTGTLYANDIVLKAGTVTVAADGTEDFYLVTSLTAGSTDYSTSTPHDVVTMDTSGDPVTVQATLNLVPSFAEPTIAQFNAWAELSIDGVADSDTRIFGEARVVQDAYALGRAQAYIAIPLLLRATPAAGTHDFGINLHVTWCDASGNPVATGGGDHYITFKTYMVVTENHV